MTSAQMHPIRTTSPSPVHETLLERVIALVAGRPARDARAEAGGLGSIREAARTVAAALGTDFLQMDLIGPTEPHRLFEVGRGNPQGTLNGDSWVVRMGSAAQGIDNEIVQALDIVAIAGRERLALVEADRAQRFGQAMTRISHDLSRGRPLQEQLDRIVTASGHLLQVDRASIFLLGDDRLFAGQAWWGAGGPPSRTDEPTQVEIDVLASRQPVVIADAALQENNPYFARLGVQSSLAVPLLIEDRVVGILNLHAIESRRTFTLKDVELASAFADQAAVAILNSQLYERMRSALDRLLALYQAVRVVGRSLSEVQILHTAARTARRLAGADAAVAMRGTKACCSRHEPLVDRGINQADWAALRSAAPSAPRPLGTDGRRSACAVELSGDRWLLIHGNTHVLQDAAPALLALGQHVAAALDNAILYESLGTARAELDELVRQLVRARDEEAQRIAFDVHDGIAQTLVAADQHLQAAAHAMIDGSAALRDEELDRARRLVVRGLRESRAIVNHLRPPGLDELGLVAAMAAHAAEVEATHGLEIATRLEMGATRLPRPVETMLFRALQESLTNAWKHGQAAHVSVVLAVDTNGGDVVLEIEDDGLGLPPSDRGGTGVGLRAMEDRARSVGGSVSISGTTPSGVRVRVRVPVEGEG